MFKFNFCFNISLITLFLLPSIVLVKSDKAVGTNYLDNNLSVKAESFNKQILQPNLSKEGLKNRFPRLISQNQGEQKERRVALVIGNSQYKRSPLTNPVNDASDMATVLKELGFDVIKLLDADLDTMSQGINKFQKKLGPDVIGLFYYAGHGIQVDGENYLIPTDAVLTTKDAVSTETIGLNDILKKMQSAKTKMNILILDACRNDPFTRNWGMNRTISLGQGGLAPVDAGVGSLIAYSTAPGDYAADGDGRNSPYTKQLKEQIKTPDLDIEIMFRKVRAGVYEETKRNQIPWVSVSITKSFTFKTTQDNNNNNNTTTTTTTTTTTQDNNNNPSTLRENILPVIVAAKAISPKKMYERLEYFLSNKQWQKADQQTWEIIRQVSNYGSKISVSVGEIDNFSCPDLKLIDKLWLKYSDNHFGLSVQQKIYQNYTGNNTNSFPDFAKQIGWRRVDINTNKEEYLLYNELTFSLDAPVGHFPTTAGVDGLSSIARTWASYATEYESFIVHLLDRVAVCK